MAEEQPTFKIVDRRPFNSDGTPRELSAEEREEAERAEKAAAVQEAAVKAATAEAATPKTTASPSAHASSHAKPKTATPRAEHAQPRTAGDPLDDPASFLSLIMSLASNAAASLGMMAHSVTGETGVDLKSAKHWIDVLGMLENKTQGNLDEQEAQVLEGLLADLRMQYVSLSSSPTPEPAKFSASDITGGK